MGNFWKILTKKNNFSTRLFRSRLGSKKPNWEHFGKILHPELEKTGSRPTPSLFRKLRIVILLDTISVFVNSSFLMIKIRVLQAKIKSLKMKK